MPAERTFTARHVQLTRAALAAVAALMITFSPDHSASVGLPTFGGFVIATALVLVLAAIIVYPAGHRWPAVIIAGISFVLGMTAGIPSIRSDALFFGLVIAWAASTGLVELIHGIRSKGTEGARDATLIGSLGLLLALLLALVPAGFVMDYTTPQGAASLTGIIIGVGMFGGYAAIIAVFLGIAGLTPGAKKAAQADAEKEAGTDSLADHGGYA
ncbi:acyl-CoA synthetase [Microbacterium sp.]|uniref:acyl-CoA synthetase n=1 Tax=Microbacterium sp. TaxID=51671 RepID=UPI003A909E50